VTSDNALLSADIFEAVVTAFAEALVSHYRERCSRLERQAIPEPPDLSAPQLNELSPWLRVSEAAKRAQCARSTIYSEVQAGRLRAARAGGRMLRIRANWVDAWLEGGGEPVNPKENDRRGTVAASRKKPR
jgi:excisionase family DNA binding protein